MNYQGLSPTGAKLASVLAFLALPLPLLAQGVPKDPTGGQVEQSLRKSEDPKELPEKARPTIQVPPREEMKSADDAKVKIRVERFAIVGNRSVPTADLVAALSRGSLEVHAELTLKDIKAEANRLTNVYRDRGFGLAWAYVPAQDVKEGVVELAVVEGRVDKVLVEGNKHYSAEFIINHVFSGNADRATDIDELERGLLILNDYPGLTVRATLRPGDVMGSTDLYLSAEDKFPVSLSVDFDNFGAKDVGQNRLGGTLQLFNLWDMGHYLTLRAVGGIDAAEGKMESGTLSYAIPLASGTLISVTGSWYDYTGRGGNLTAIDPTGTGETYQAMVSHPLIRNHTMTVGGELGFEVKNIHQELMGTTTAHDRLRAVVVGGQFDWTDDWTDGRWVANVEDRQGLGPFAGGLKNNDPNSSRLGGDDSFNRVNVLIYRLQKILDWVHLIGRVQGQYSRDTLVVSEQFSLGGQDSVRGYPVFEFMGDYGYSATAELRVKIPFLQDVHDPISENRSIIDMIQAVGFIDGGEGVRNNAAFNELSRRVLTGAGVGVRLDYPDRLSIRFDLGWPLTKEGPLNGDVREYYISVILNLH